MRWRVGMFGLWVGCLGVAGVLLFRAAHPPARLARPPAPTRHVTTMSAPASAPHAAEPRRANRLIHEKSPYLQQHASNPVDWYPWGQDAFDKATREQKPIFLSIGYSTCHWCHVMERESFEDPAIAALMNASFVSIKVDREEHPDVDQVYMRAVTAMTGQGGWPLTVFLTPDLKPFFGGTYFPPHRRSSMPGLDELLPEVATAWQTKRQEVAQSADQLVALLRQELAPSARQPEALTDAVLQTAFDEAASAFDPIHGGFGGAPKFPRSHELSLLLHVWARTGTAQALEMVTTTLEQLARGGIHDQLGGGFHRYSTDQQWLVPHFEKMLYDQALLARTFLEAYQVTHRQEFNEAARDIFEYVLRDMTDPQGGFYAAEDADSEGQEGKFYVWRPDEMLAVLGQEDGELVNRFYGVTTEGNFEQQTSILHIEQPLEHLVKGTGEDPSALARRLASARQRLLTARSTRIRPHRDDKVLTSWNGLMIAAFAYGGSVLDEPRYLEAARRAAQFLLQHARRNGQLLRRYREGEARYPGTLEDYAFFTDGLLELYTATGEAMWLAEAKSLAKEMVAQFWDATGGGLFLRSRTQEPLIISSKEIYDGATPSGNSVAALVFLKLGRLTADQTFESYGRRLLETFAGQVQRSPFAYPQLLIAWDFALGPTKEIVITGDPALPDTAQMLHAFHQRFLPRTVLAVHQSGEAGAAVEALIPYVKTQRPLNGKATAYVCENYICSLPVTTVPQFESLLDTRTTRALR